MKSLFFVPLLLAMLLCGCSNKENTVPEKYVMNNIEIASFSYVTNNNNFLPEKSDKNNFRYEYIWDESKEILEYVDYLTSNYDADIVTPYDETVDEGKVEIVIHSNEKAVRVRIEYGDSICHIALTAE